MKSDPSKDYVDYICGLYNDHYDDRMEDSRPGGADWMPGVTADHKSIAAFQKELENDYGIKLSRSKLQKILITGDCWTTERSRMVQEMFCGYMADGMSPADAVRRIAGELEISTVAVNINLPYGKVVYGVPGRSRNAIRCERWRRK